MTTLIRIACLFPNIYALCHIVEIDNTLTSKPALFPNDCKKPCCYRQNTIAAALVQSPAPGNRRAVSSASHVLLGQAAAGRAAPGPRPGRAARLSTLSPSTHSCVCTTQVPARQDTHRRDNDPGELF